MVQPVTHKIACFPEYLGSSRPRWSVEPGSPAASMAHHDILHPAARLQHRLRLERAVERRRILRELHDELGQHLTAVQLMLVPLLKECQNGPLQGPLQQVAALVDRTVAALRRVLGDQRPPLLDGRGATAALRAIGQDSSRNLGLNLSVRVFGSEPPVSDALALALYRVAQEALTNIARHARAEVVRMRLRWESEHVTLVLEDDGVGLPADALARRGCFGLRGMRERVAALGGELDFSRRRGGGTCVCARLPLRPPPQPSRAAHP